MGLSPAAVLAQGAPVVLETLFTHYFNRKKTVKDSAARSELLFDEAFSVMKAFLEVATKNTVENLQRFSNAHLPSPPSILVVPVLIPFSSCALAAGHLVRAFGGADEARRVVGGTEWWRVRGLKGVEAEWIVGKRMWAEREREQKRRASEGGKHANSKGKDKSGQADPPAAELGADEDEADLDEQMGNERMDEMRCMLYIHGGAYYWGSINTHRYTIWRYARKMHGRAFAVNYRKAPQYPFPCALQDALAAYLYLLYPPPEAKHTAVKPSDIVIAGDSAGGGLTLALLMVLRDAGLPLPSGAVAISPWCDLTHSFPSVMENFATDVMPPYGFIHKPSTLWPPPAPELSESVQRTLKARVKDAVGRLRGDHPTPEAVDVPAGAAAADDDDARSSGSSDSSKSGASDADEADPAAQASAAPAASKTQTTAKGDEIRLPPSPVDPADSSDRGDLSHAAHLSPSAAGRKLHPHTEGSSADEDAPPVSGGDATQQGCKGKQRAVDPTDGKDLVIEIDGHEQVIRGQIQHYATNALLPHPYVSPAFGYLGGLCPLLIIASDKELLRDEILFTAHRAAHPDRYPIPPHVIKLMPHLEGINERYGPTQVHLQVYDEVCHVLPLYSMTTPAKYCFRAIATFCKFVTAPVGQRRTPSPSPLFSPANSPAPSAPGTPDGTRQSEPLGGPVLVFGDDGKDADGRAPAITRSPEGSLDVGTSSPALAVSTSSSSTSPAGAHGSTPSSPVHVQSPTTTSSPATSKRRWLTVDGRLSGSRAASEDVAGPRFPDVTEPPPPEGPETAGHPSVYTCPEGRTDPFIDDGMIRERISTRGLRRPLEPEADLPGLHVPFDELAKIKELPAKRYLTGQTLWDKKFAHTARRVERNRRKNLARSQKDTAKVVHAWQERLARNDGTAAAADVRKAGEEFLLGDGVHGSQWDWALKGERPPPSAVVSRRDTGEAVKLARIADQSDDDSKLGGVNLWTSAIDLLTRSGSGLRTPRHEPATPSGSASSTATPPATGPPTPKHKGPSPLSAPGSGYTSAAEGSDVEGAPSSGRHRTGSRFQVPSFLRRASTARGDAEPEREEKH